MEKKQTNKYAYNSYSCWVKGGRLDPGRYGVQVAYSIVLALPTLMLVCSALLVSWFFVLTIFTCGDKSELSPQRPPLTDPRLISRSGP